MIDPAERRDVGGTARADHGPLAPAPLELRVLAEKVRILYARAPIAQATVVVNAGLVWWVFRGLVSPAAALAWVAALCGLAALRIGLVRAYRRHAGGPADAARWAQRFAAETVLTGVGWGAAALVFYVPQSPVHQLFLAFVLGGMTAGAASSNASYRPAFAGFAAPALAPMVVRLAAEASPIYASMAFMVVLFGVAVAGISWTGGRALDEAIRLRFRNEVLVEALTAAQQRLEGLNADLERRVEERTAELQRMLVLRIESEARLAVTLRSIGDAVVTTDPEARVTLFNPVAEALTGWSAEEAVGAPLTDVLQALDERTRRPAAYRLDRVLGEGTVIGPERRILRARDGTERFTAGSAAPIRDGAGRVLGAVLVFRDQTPERLADEALRESDQRHRALAESLRESDRRKGEFIAVLSHELRNPLAPIQNCLFVLDRAAPESQEAAQARQILRRQTDHLARLVDDLLDVTRISRGKIELRRARVDLREIVRRTCEDHRSLFRRRQIELRVDAAPASDPLWIDADETRISQVVANLLQNAAKFSRPGGTVAASVAAAEGRAEIRVRDDGIGIPPDLLPRVFEPFVQAEDGLARSLGGLGLGLALARSLVELHGGSIQARSEGAGRGSEFVVSLPLAAAATAPNPAPPPRVREADHPSLEILVIEDNPDEAQSLAAVLELEGHRVHIARDGGSGLARARELEPEVILCDIGLPDFDGYQLARALKRGDGTPARLIALTGYAQPEDRRRAREAGFDAHLAKPPPLDVLLNLLRTGSGE